MKNINLNKFLSIVTPLPFLLFASFLSYFSYQNYSMISSLEKTSDGLNGHMENTDLVNRLVSMHSLFENNYFTLFVCTAIISFVLIILYVTTIYYSFQEELSSSEFEKDFRENYLRKFKFAHIIMLMVTNIYSYFYVKMNVSKTKFSRILYLLNIIVLPIFILVINFIIINNLIKFHMIVNDDFRILDILEKSKSMVFVSLFLLIYIVSAIIVCIKRKKITPIDEE